MARINLLEIGFAGVDLKSNPLLLVQKRKLRSAVNLVFEEGVIKTRPGFEYTTLAGPGSLQGSCLYRPSRGISAGVFSDQADSFACVIDGCLWIGCRKVASDIVPPTGDAFLYQAENYLIIQHPQGPTYWWDGETLKQSPGLRDVDFVEESTPDIRFEHDVPTPQPVVCEIYDDGGGGSLNTSLRFIIVHALTGAPIEGASIGVIKNETSAYAGTSNVTGEWSVDRVFPGDYTYGVSKAGFLPVVDVEFTIIAGIENVVTVPLTPVPVEGCNYTAVVIAGPATDEVWLGGYVDVSVENTGTDDLTIFSVNSDRPYETDPELPVVIPPDTALTLRVGTKNADDAGVDFNFSLISSCGESEIIVEEFPCSFTVDPLPVGGDVTDVASVEITNDGDGPVVLSFYLNGLDFTVDPEAPFELPSGDSQVFTFTTPGEDIRGLLFSVTDSCDQTTDYHFASE